MSVKFENSWNRLFDTLREISMDRLFRVADERLAVPVRDLVLYDDILPAKGGGLAHYTSWENLLEIFDSEKEGCPVLRMYNYESANDPEEGQIMPPEWRKLDREIKVLSAEHDPKNVEKQQAGSTYGCSFSTNDKAIEDDLMFWRLYGNDGEGCSLKLGTMPDGMYKVRYRGGRRKPGERTEDLTVTKRLEELLKVGKETIDRAPAKYKGAVGKSIAKALRRVLDRYRHLVKSRAYEHENEWRMIKVTPPKKEIKYDVSGRIVRRYIIGGKIEDLFLSASRITLGPRVPKDYGVAKEYIEHLVRNYGMEHRIEVAVSTKRYRRDKSVRSSNDEEPR